MQRLFLAETKTSLWLNYKWRQQTACRESLQSLLLCLTVMFSKGLWLLNDKKWIVLRQQIKSVSQSVCQTVAESYRNWFFFFCPVGPPSVKKSPVKSLSFILHTCLIRGMKVSLCSPVLVQGSRCSTHDDVLPLAALSNKVALESDVLKCNEWN